MPITADAVLGLIQRRGSVIGWLHGAPPDPASINPLTGQPEASLGGPKLPAGTFGESYPSRARNIRAYIGGKSLYKQYANYGNLEVGDLSICIPVPFSPEPWNAINPLPDDLLAAYNDGDFAVTIAKREAYTDERPTMSYDRFTWSGKIYIAKARPTAIVDANVTVAWRLMLAEFSI